MQNIKALVFGFVGAFLFHTLQVQLFPVAQAGADKVVTAQRFDLVDKSGKLRGQWGFAQEGPPGFWLMDEKGIARVVMGLYPDGSGHMGLQDKQGQMIQLARAFGSDEVPFLIFKHKGSDSMIMGLNSGDQAPFLMHYEKDRKRKLEFGIYNGP